MATQIPKPRPLSSIKRRRTKPRGTKPKKQYGINPSTLLHGKTTVSRKPVKNTTYGKSIDIKKCVKLLYPPSRKHIL